MPESYEDPQSPDEYPLSPGEPLPAAQRPLPVPVIASREPPRDAEADQFTLSELLWLVAIAAVLLSTISSIARWTSLGKSPADLAAVYATILGCGALVGMIVLAWMPRAQRIITVSWWALLSLYIVTAAAAVLMSR